MEEIKKKIEEMVKKVTTDPTIKDLFAKDPIKAVEKVLGVDLPDDQIKAIVEGVKAKLTADKLSGVANALGGLLGKK